MALPKVSIIITTRNRAEHLRQTLASLGRMHVPTDLPTELLIVDNASTDDTAEVIKTSCLPNLPVRYLHEAKRGQSNARNSGMDNTTGEVILFTDDDVRVPENWVEAMTAPIRAGLADAVAGGVNIALHLERAWMRPVHRGFLTSTECLHPDDPQTMIGANMAFHRKTLDRVSSFDPELGPGALGFGDDGLFAAQLQRAGYRIAGALANAVEHHFDSSRLLRASFLADAAKRGQTKAYLDYHWYHKDLRNPFLRYLSGRTRLAILRLCRMAECAGVEGCPEWEIEHVRWVNRCRQALVERKRPRNYDRCGLQKLGPC
jgi:glycosyltransferase involved in cell wall biosynthesis